MTAVAHNIPFTPAQPQKRQQGRPRREKGTYTLLDNPVIDYCKRVHNASASILIALAERLNLTRKDPAMSEAELAVACGLGASAVAKNIRLLKQAGLAEKSKDGRWTYTPKGHRADDCTDKSVDNRADNYPKFFPKKANWDSFCSPLKELEGIRRYKNNNIYSVGGYVQAERRPGAAVGDNPSENLGDQAQGEKDRPSPSQTNLIHSQAGMNTQATGFKNIPPATPPAAGDYRAHMAALQAAGLQPLWGRWVALGRLTRPTQEVQIAGWASYIAEGRAAELAEDAAYIIESGSYDHPWRGLQSRMAERNSAAVAAAQVEVQAVLAQRPALCQEGEQRRAPNGEVWTVDYVVDGYVVFVGSEDYNHTDAQVANWELIGSVQ